MEEHFVDYLKTRQLKPLMIALKKQYVRLSKLSGTIEVFFNTQDEIDALALFLNEDYYDVKNSVKIPITKIRNRLESTQFAGHDLIKVLEMYFNESLLTKQQIIHNEMNKNENVKAMLRARYANTSLETWLFDKTNTISSKMIEFAKVDVDSLFLILDALLHIPYWDMEQQSLALFATKHTKDPHFFDAGFTLSVLLNYLGYIFKRKTSHLNLIEKNELLLQGGLLKEGILNFCTVFQIRCKTYSNDLHSGLEYFASTGESVNLHLKNIVQISEFFGFDIVLILENPSVFQIIQSWLYEHKYTHIALVCSHGELNFATYHLIDKVVDANIRVLYAGDFDPEGLLIAQRMTHRYQDKVELVCYQTHLYLKAMSDKDISDTRLMKLQNCTVSSLQEMKQMLMDHKKCGYQEALIDDYIAVLQNIH